MKRELNMEWVQEDKKKTDRVIWNPQEEKDKKGVRGNETGSDKEFFSKKYISKKECQKKVTNFFLKIFWKIKWKSHVNIKRNQYRKWKWIENFHCVVNWKDECD